MNRMQRAVLVAVWGGVCLAVPGLAHEGHDHGDAPVQLPDTGDQPKRLADGSVFLPKPTQRQLAIRTQVAQQLAVPQSIELSGQVVLDPQRGGRVQALLAGRLEAGAQGLPLPGSRVKKGQVLARILPAAGQLERAGQVAQLAELTAALQLAEKRLARLQELRDSVPGREIEAAASEIGSLRARVAALNQGLSGSDALIAPVDGVVAAVNGVAGQVVEAGALIFEITDPDSLFVEASAYAGLPCRTSPGPIWLRTVAARPRRRPVWRWNFSALPGVCANRRCPCCLACGRRGRVCTGRWGNRSGCRCSWRRRWRACRCRVLRWCVRRPICRRSGSRCMPSSSC